VNVETISKLKKLLHVNQQTTTNELPNELGVLYLSAQAILTELQMRWVCAKLVL
jgi:hypothetical protein